MGAPIMHQASERLTITEFDQVCLLGYIFKKLGGIDSVDGHIRDFREKLLQADIISSQAVPNNIVTMHSRIRLVEEKTGRKETIKLVYPTEANPNKSKISVLDPLGSSLLGRRVGDLVATVEDAQPVLYRIDNIIYQPEAEGWLL